MMDELNKTTVLFEDDGWLLLDGDMEYTGAMWLDTNPYKSGIYHKCVKHPQIKRVSSCHRDWESELWRCSNCDILVPMEVVGVWTLHNFDSLADEYE